MTASMQGFGDVAYHLLLQIYFFNMVISLEFSVGSSLRQTLKLSELLECYRHNLSFFDNISSDLLISKLLKSWLENLALN